MYSSIVTLTCRQAEVLEYLKKYQHEKGSSPTYREIAEHFGFKSPKAATDHINALVRKGFIRCHPGRSRGIELVVINEKATEKTIPVPILGHTPAGSPELQTEIESESLAVDPLILGNSTSPALFALRVIGESMVGRGIYDGDWVIADADEVPIEGDIVVALIDGENTLKTLAKSKTRYYLKAENPHYPDFFPYQEMATQGVVKAVLRRI
jgi:repressor LexA